MQEPERQQITLFLQALAGGDRDRTKITDSLFTRLYGELRKLAGALLHGERAGHTLQPTALVHEAYTKLVDQSRVDWQCRAHFMGVAGQAMRRVLVDHARRRAAAKRGGDRERVTLAAVSGVGDRDLELIELDRVLTRLAGESERAARVAELKLFAGLTTKEIALVLGVSRRTITGDWTTARLWLSKELNG